MIDHYLGQHICLFLPWKEAITISKSLQNYILKNTKFKVWETEIVAVGMRYRSADHRFSSSDNITIKRERDNFYDKNAILVEVDGKSVAYIARKDAIRLVNYLSIHTRIEIKLKRNRQRSALFTCRLTYPSYINNQ